MRIKSSAGRKPLCSTEQTERVSICLTGSFVERLDRRARKEISMTTGKPKSRSELMRGALEYYLSAVERRGSKVLAI